MLNPLNFLSKLIKSHNQKQLDKLQTIVKKVNAFENDLLNLKDTEFPIKTLELKNRIKNGLDLKKFSSF